MHELLVHPGDSALVRRGLQGLFPYVTFSVETVVLNRIAWILYTGLAVFWVEEHMGGRA